MSDVWSHLPGQELAVRQLRQDLPSPTHAWLITGPPGSGRIPVARAFAAALNCEQSHIADRGCAQCQSCKTTLAGNHPDVTFVETEKSTIGIEEVRALVMKAQDRPAVGRWRILIIGDADRMLERTTNVLLKAIEEPPPRTLWILCAPSSADILVTIRSRCRLIGLRTPPVDAVAHLLHYRDGVPPELALPSARSAQSHVGMARRLAQNAEVRERRHNVVRLPLQLREVPDAVRVATSLMEFAKADAESLTAQRNLEEKSALLRSLGIGENTPVPATLRPQIKRLEDEQKRRSKRAITDALDRTLTDLLSFYRDALMLQIAPEQHEHLVNMECRSDLERFIQGVSPEWTLQKIDAIHSVRRQLLTTNVAPLLTLETLMLNLL